MLDIFVQAVLIVFGLFFAYTAIISFRRPKSFAAALGLTTIGRSGEVEIRAQYGGFFLAAAICQFAPFVTDMASTTALAVGLVIFGGLILGRLAALFSGSTDEQLLPTVRALYWIDGGGALLALTGLYMT
ncbi:MAG: hypothetical protein COA62_02885 [Rhodobiaceae bacterium]|nr:MAG: hypothetical protein COA62_02885 [Rhodobiaceae bacterium]